MTYFIASQLDTNRTDYSGINKLWGSWVYAGRRCLVEAAAHGCSSQPSRLREETLFSGSFLLYCKIAKLWFLEVGGCQHSKGTQANWAPWTSPGLSASRHGPCCPWALVPYPTWAPLERLCAHHSHNTPNRQKISPLNLALIWQKACAARSRNLGSCTFQFIQVHALKVQVTISTSRSTWQ